MKKILITIMASVLCISAVHAEKKNLSYLPDVKITDTTFVKDNREVTLRMDLDISGLRVGTQHTVALIPVYVSADGSRTQDFPSVVIDGKTRRKIYLRSQKLGTVDAPPFHDETAQVILRSRDKENLAYEYEAVLPYERWMLNGRVELREKVHGCVNCEKGLSRIPLIGDALPEYMPDYKTRKLEPEPEPIKERHKKSVARIQFKWDDYVILENYRNNRAELDTVINSILYVKENPDMEIVRINIDGYASPEGTIAHNEILSKNRAIALSEYVKKVMKFNDSVMHVNWHGEDWTGFTRMMLKDNRYPYLPRRAELVEILKDSLSMNSDQLQERMEALEPKAEIYGRLLDELYPELRRNEYVITYNVRNFDVEEAKEIIKTNPELLSLKEIYMVAGTYTKGTPEYEWTMDTAAKVYPKSACVLNDMAHELMEAEDWKGIIALLGNVKGEPADNPTLHNTLGVAYANDKQPYKALEEFQKAIALDKEPTKNAPEAEHNLAEVNKVIDQL